MSRDASSPARVRLPWGNRLAFRLSVGLGAGSTLVLLAVGAWNLHRQRSQLTDLVGLSAEGSAETIRRATRNAMLQNEPEDVDRILQDIAAQSGVRRIRIFDKQGRIITSTDAHEVGDYVDKGAEMCWGCHAREEPLQSLDLEDRQREFTDSEGEHVLGVIAPIRNEPDCANAACHAHSAGQRVLGVLDVQLSLAPVDAHLLASERRLGLGLFMLVVAVVGVALALAWRLILRPVQRLTLATQRVRDGRLDTRLPVTSRTELGLLARSWNEMIEELARTRAELEDWSRTLEERVSEKTRQLEVAVQQMIVVEKMASLGKLAAVVAHELNNPLTGIGTYARLLGRRLAACAEAGREIEDGQVPSIAGTLDLIADEAGRCGEIVRNLLAFSRGNGARCLPESLPPILQRAALLLRHQAEMRSIELVVDAADGLPQVECDAGQIEQMILALGMNALDAVGRDGRVEIRAEANGRDGVVLLVRDNGCGIRKEDLHRIFEPFYTTKEGGRSVGLGLAVVYGIVERHHGAIQVDSEPGVGTTFHIHLPLRQPTEPTPAAPASVAGGAA
ncbi:MAG: sensor histidine kinase [Planctomycetota bacterium]|nr:MAG: sensor histidine kinase [Planctomycetota bacterium]